MVDRDQLEDRGFSLGWRVAEAGIDCVVHPSWSAHEFASLPVLKGPIDLKGKSVGSSLGLENGCFFFKTTPVTPPFSTTEHPGRVLQQGTLSSPIEAAHDDKVKLCGEFRHF